MRSQLRPSALRQNCSPHARLAPFQPLVAASHRRASNAARRLKSGDRRVAITPAVCVWQSEPRGNFFARGQNCARPSSVPFEGGSQYWRGISADHGCGCWP